MTTSTLTGSVDMALVDLSTNGQTLDVAAGATLNAGTVELTGAAAALNVAGSLVVSGTLIDENNNSTFSDYLGTTGLNATGTASVVIGDIILGPFGLVSVGAAASIEIGTGGYAAAGDFTIDPGTTLTGTGSIASETDIQDHALVVDGLLEGLAMENQGTLTGSGTILVDARGVFYNFGEIASDASLTFVANASAALFLPYGVDAGNTISLAGPETSVSFTTIGSLAGDTFDVQAPIVGFTYGDTINVEMPGVVSRGSFATGPDGVGTLTLLDVTGIPLATLRLIGDYSTDSFVLSPFNPADFSNDGEVQINLAEATDAGVSAGTGTPDSYAWIGPVGGAWNDPANWADISTGTTPSAIAPGTNDLATLSSAAVISGAGTAASLQIDGQVYLGGTFTTGLATITGQTGGLQVDPGATLTATGIAINAPYGAAINVIGAGAILVVQGAVGLTTYSALDVSAGATVQIGGVGLSAYNGITLGDRFSELEIGTLDDGAAGTLSLDAGQVFALGTGSALLAPVIALDGQINAANGTRLSGTLTGTGTFDVLAGVFAGITGAVAADSALTFNVGAGGALQLPDDLPATATITLAGSSDSLEFVSATPSTTLAVAGTIAGFVYGDNLLVDTADPVADATFVAGAPGSNGTLDLTDAAGTVVGTLALAGTYTSDHFMVTPLSSDGTLAQINIADATFALSPGSGAQHRYTWIGPSGGAWGDPADWRDSTAGGVTASVAPGIGDIVTITGQSSSAALPALVVAGVGSVATLALNGHIAFDGQFSAGSVTDSSPVEIAAGSTLSAGTLTLTAYQSTISALGAGALLTVSGTADVAEFGALLASAGGGRLQLGGARLDYAGTLAVADTLSALEIGTAGTGAVGALTIDPGFTTGGTQSMIQAPAIVVNGTLASASLTAIGTLSGSGTVVVPAIGFFTDDDAIADGSLLLEIAGNAGSLNLAKQIGTGNTISLTGSFDTLSLGSVYPPDGQGSLAVGATITGLADSDTIKLVDGPVVASAIFTQISATGGTLALTDGAGDLLGDLLLEGTYTSSNFVPHLDADSSDTVLIDDISIVACYATGTRIATPAGEIAVECLRAGDPVCTSAGAVRPVRWIGCRSYDGRFLAGRRDVLPIVIRAGALADGVPSRDLQVSPKHAMFVDGVLIPAELLVNGRSVVQLDHVESLTYHHIELDSHDILVAEGAPSESFIDHDSRMMFQNAAEFLLLHPVPAPMQDCAPRIEDGEVLARLRRRLADRAGLVADHVDDTATDGPLDGRIDILNEQEVSGWAFDATRRRTPVRLEILDGNRVIGSVIANRFRPDLKQARLGDGRCAYVFHFDVPPADLQAIWIRRARDGTVFPTPCAASFAA